MNERLEKEIQGCQMVYRGLFHEHTNHCELIRGLFMEAYHFALDDVKAKLKVVADHYNNDPRYDGGCALDELYDFIDKLSK